MSIVEAQDDGPYELIIEVGAEGGSLRLMATRTVPTQYAVFLDDHSLTLFEDGEAIQHRSPWGSWAQGMKAFSRYPWPKLHPKWVHPAHAARVWPLLEPVWDELRKSNQDDWAELCGQDARTPDFDTGPLKRGDRA